MWRSVYEMAEMIEYELSAAEATQLDLISGDAVASLATRRSGALGARFGMRAKAASVAFTAVHSASATVDVPHDTRFARQQAMEAIAEFGHVIPDPNGTKDGSVWGIVRSGLMNMVPALVRVDIEPSAGGSIARVVAMGREGLIKQRIGAKAADRIGIAMQADRGSNTVQ